MLVDKKLKTVVIVAFNGVQVLDVTGPSSVFSSVERDRPGSYKIVIASPHGGTIETNSGVTLANTVPLTDLPSEIDTILVAGGDEDSLLTAVNEDGVADWIETTTPTVRRMGSICTGAFILAAAGLLDDRRATTHWFSCQRLQALCPAAEIDSQAIFTVDPPIYTSAGVTTGIDLALALVEADFGNAQSAKTARDLVVFIRRPGNQNQLSAGLIAQEKANGRIKELLTWIIEHPTADLSIPALASQVGMSERNFARAFKRETGRTPAWLVEQIRLERVTDMLERSDWPLAKIAQQSGFGSVDALQRGFRRKMGTTPTAYRDEHARIPGFTKS